MRELTDHFSAEIDREISVILDSRLAEARTAFKARYQEGIDGFLRSQIHHDITPSIHVGACAADLILEGQRRGLLTHLKWWLGFTVPSTWLAWLAGSTIEIYLFIICTATVLSFAATALGTAMVIDNEKKLQELFALYLKSGGHDVEVEKILPDGNRADIVTRRSIFEVKRVLTRDHVYQAAGQLQAYRLFFPDHQLFILGLMPKSKDAARGSIKATESLAATGVTVIYADQETGFIDFCYQLEPRSGPIKRMLRL